MPTSRKPSILDAVRDVQLFAPWFKAPATWAAWYAFLAALFALPMSPEQLTIYRKCTGRNAPPTTRTKEAWLVCGRRAGKSFVLALIAVFLACFNDYRRFLSPGERGVVLIIASDRRQARVIFRYIRGLLTGIPMLARMIERETADAFDLTNSVSIEVGTASFKSVRGYSIVAALCDEIAFWPSESSVTPDYEILDAVRPAMATIPGAMLLCASSPYAQRGALFDAFRRNFGHDDAQALIWKAPTRVMNPSVPQSFIDEALQRDPASAAAEYMAEFRTDVESFIQREVVEAAVASGRHELPPLTGLSYVAFTDPSGGSSDAMTLAIAHREKATNRAVLDAVREVRPPFSPDGAVQDFAALLKSYRVHKVSGDRYGGEWPRERFRVHLAEKPKSDLYRDMLPLLNSGRAELIDNPRLIAQLCGLERRTARGGKDSIDHCPGAHDDVANAVAGALVMAAGGPPPLLITAAVLARSRAPKSTVVEYHQSSRKVLI
jgi:hypothetical protein